MNNPELRESIYGGNLQKLPASVESMRLLEIVEAAVVDSFGQDYRSSQFEMSSDDYFALTVETKKLVFESEVVHRAAFDLLSAQGFALSDTALDPPRVRFIEHNGHLNPSAKVAYQAHRDVWYANPQSQINWWIPLHNVTEVETFCFYNDLFSQPVANTSSQFDYDVWMRTVGFGKSHRGDPNSYPLPTADLPSIDSALEFSLKRGEILLFSAAHLHQTLPNKSGLTRVSIDFRTVNIGDENAGIGAPNADNESKGTALSSYLRMAAKHA